MSGHFPMTTSSTNTEFCMGEITFLSCQQIHDLLQTGEVFTMFPALHTAVVFKVVLELVWFYKLYLVRCCRRRRSEGHVFTAQFRCHRNKRTTIEINWGPKQGGQFKPELQRNLIRFLCVIFT
ncbi:hypothetical protein Scep_015712 [Stephania cephalantha]|uniref:Uncharacterized protein n=1 Tax=Stephania cephalantha TaxID=152367 RepID=A0AAP0P454_9MAGN